MLVNINVSFYSQQKHVRANSRNIFDLHFHDKLLKIIRNALKLVLTSRYPERLRSFNHNFYDAHKVN